MHHTTDSLNTPRPKWQTIGHANTVLINLQSTLLAPTLGNQLSMKFRQIHNLSCWELKNDRAQFPGLTTLTALGFFFLTAKWEERVSTFNLTCSSHLFSLLILIVEQLQNKTWIQRKTLLCSQKLADQINYDKQAQFPASHIFPLPDFSCLLVHKTVCFWL